MKDSILKSWIERKKVHLHKWVDILIIKWVYCWGRFFLFSTCTHICVCVCMCDERMFMCLNMYSCIEARGQSCVFVDLHLISWGSAGHLFRWTDNQWALGSTSISASNTGAWDMHCTTQHLTTEPNHYPWSSSNRTEPACIHCLFSGLILLSFIFFHENDKMRKVFLAR